MSVFTISDLHLSLGEDKPMDIFGKGWENYTELIEKNWKELISDDDLVIVPGDISWAMSPEEAVTDLAFVNGLPGKKVILKGNHEYWWSTMAKLEQLKKANQLDTIQFFHNNGYFDEKNGFMLAGTRGWMVPDDQNFKADKDEAIYKREVFRLESSIKKALADGESKGAKDTPLFVFLHYPPFSRNGASNAFMEILDKYNVTTCFFGHLHGMSCNIIKKPEQLNTPVKCISADYLKFIPVKILE